MITALIASLLLSQSQFIDGEQRADKIKGDSNYSFGFSSIQLKNLGEYDTVAIVKYQGQIAPHDRDRFLGQNMQPLTPRSYAADILEVHQCLKGNATGTIRGVYRVFSETTNGGPAKRSDPPKENATYIFIGSKPNGQKLRADMVWDAVSKNQQDFPIYTTALANNEYMGLALFETHILTLRVSSDPKAVFLYAVADAFKNADDRTVGLLCQAMTDLKQGRSRDVFHDYDERFDSDIPMIEGIPLFDNDFPGGGWLKSKFGPAVMEAYSTLSDYGKLCVLASFELILGFDKDMEYLEILERFDAEEKFRQLPRTNLYFRKDAPYGDKIQWNTTINRIVDMIFTVKSPALRKHILSKWIYKRPADQYVLKLIDLLESPSVIERGYVLREFAQWHRKDYPGVDLVPKGNWAINEPITNEAFLQQFWRTHPP